MSALVELLPIRQLKPHEGTDPNRVERIKEEILSVGAILNPLWVEKEYRVVLNGHHRLQALTDLGCRFVPSILLNYEDDRIKVGICPGATVNTIDKKSIIERALQGALYPPRSSLHKLRFSPPCCFISLLELTHVPA